METYHKIQTLFKRHQDGKYKGRMIRGAWTTPELQYLAPLKWSFSEKVDGTNVRVGFHLFEDSLTCEFAGRTDAAMLPKPLLAWLKEKFPNSPTGSGANATVGRWMLDHELTDVILFGEGYGNKIQNGGNYVEGIVNANRALEEGQPKTLDQKFVLFDVKVGGFWLDRANVYDVGQHLGLEVVPEIGQGSLQDAIDIVETGLTFNDRGGAVRWGANGLKSQWGNFEAEGIVARPLVPLFDRKGQRIITKIKAVDFK